MLYSIEEDINDEDVILHEGSLDGIESMEFHIPIVEDVTDELLLDEPDKSSQQSAISSQRSMETSSQDSEQSVSCV